jgi:hypothetical protein
MHARLFFALPAFMKRKHLWRAFFTASLVTALMLAGAVRVEAKEEKLPDTFGLRLGGYKIQNADTIARLDSNDAPVGAYIDFRDTLGGDTKATVVRLDGFYRFNERHGLGFAWYDVKFTGSRMLDRDVEWGGQTYPVNTQVDSELKFDVYQLNYRYSLFHNEEAELGALVGLHVMRFSAGISASGISQSQSQAATAPLPVWGLFADYKFTPRFSTYYTYQVFNINYQDKVTGGLQDFLLGLEYRLFRHFALGAAYNRFALHMKSKGDAATLYLDTNWNGGLLYGAVYF